MANDGGIPIVNLPNLYINNLTAAYLTATNFQVNYGQCRDSTNTYDMVLNAPVVGSISNVGLNGLDKGPVVINSVYYVYLISDPVTYLPTGIILSLNNNKPLMPFGYSAYRWIGMVLVNGAGTLFNFVITGTGKSKTFVLEESTTNLLFGSGTDTTPTLVPNLSFFVPVNPLEISGAVNCYFSLTFSAAASPDYVNFYTAINAGSGSYIQLGSGAASSGGSYFRTEFEVGVYPISGVPSLYYANSAMGDTTLLYYQGCDLEL